MDVLYKTNVQGRCLGWKYISVLHLYLCILYICIYTFSNYLYIYILLLLSCFSHVWLFATHWIVALQAPLSIEFFRQEYWSDLPPGDLPNLGIKPMSLMSLALAGRFFTTGVTWEAPIYMCMYTHTHTHTHTHRKGGQVAGTNFLSEGS